MAESRGASAPADSVVFDYEAWAAALMAAIYATAREGGGRIFLHRGGPRCSEIAGASCPCKPELLRVEKDGSIR